MVWQDLKAKDYKLPHSHVVCESTVSGLETDWWLRSLKPGSDIHNPWSTHQACSYSPADPMASARYRGTAQTSAFMKITRLLRAIVKVRTKCSELLGCRWSTVWASLRDRCMLWLPPFGKISLTTHYCPVVLGIRVSWCAPCLVIFAVMSINMPKESRKITAKDRHQPQMKLKVRRTAGVLTMVLCSLFLFSPSADHDGSRFWPGDI